MSAREVAIEFLRCFCGGDIEGLAPLLASDLKFKGPFHQFSSSESYLTCLRSDPPEKCSFRVISVTEGGDSVSVFYDYEKGDETITIAQLFRIDNQRIRGFTMLGALKPIIDRTFPLDAIADAHRYMESNRQQGKIVVTVP